MSIDLFSFGRKSVLALVCRIKIFMGYKFNDYALKMATHVLVWLLLMVVPYVSTDQVFEMLEFKSDVKYFVHCLALSSVLIATFYINYLFLMTEYLLKKRYWLYFLFLSLIIAFVLFCCWLLFFYSGSGLQSILKTNAVIEMTIPLIVINAMALWLLSIVTSILWTISNRLAQSEKEKLAAQVASFKSQINPHFLFNTLNNIYAAAIVTSPKAAFMIDKLSEMMRYTMKETQQDFVPLENEINYVNSYIELQRLRLDKHVKLDCHLPKYVPSLEIAPMLLIAFIENAFKHGISYEQRCFIKIELTINKMELRLAVVNRKVSVQYDIREKSGLGIENTRHRLDLLYPTKYQLMINDKVNEFEVSLNLDLQ